MNIPSGQMETRVRQLVAGRQLREALSLLLNFLLQPDAPRQNALVNDATLLLGEVNTLRNALHTGQISDVSAEENRLSASIIDLLDRAVAPDPFARSLPDQARSGFLRHNVPPAMQLNLPKTWKVQVAAAEDQLTETALPDAVGSPTLLQGLGKYLSVDLESPDAGAFDIQADRQYRRQVLSDEILTEWEFRITPRKTGTHPLRLKVASYHPAENGDWQPHLYPLPPLEIQVSSEPVDLPEEFSTIAYYTARYLPPMPQWAGRTLAGTTSLVYFIARTAFVLALFAVGAWAAYYWLTNSRNPDPPLAIGQSVRIISPADRTAVGFGCSGAKVVRLDALGPSEWLAGLGPVDLAAAQNFVFQGYSSGSTSWSNLRLSRGKVLTLLVGDRQSWVDSCGMLISTGRPVAANLTGELIVDNSLQFKTVRLNDSLFYAPFGGSCGILNDGELHRFLFCTSDGKCWIPEERVYLPPLERLTVRDGARGPLALAYASLQNPAPAPQSAALASPRPVTYGTLSRQGRYPVNITFNPRYGPYLNDLEIWVDGRPVATEIGRNGIQIQLDKAAGPRLLTVQFAAGKNSGARLPLDSVLIGPGTRDLRLNGLGKLVAE